MTDLWSCNHPSRFWLLQPDSPGNIWQDAIRLAMPVLELPTELVDVETVPAITLGEGQFGTDHFQLNLSKRLYYQLKPLIPRSVINLLKQVNARYSTAGFPLRWPIEDSYARFQWEVIHQMLILTGETRLTFRHFWPNANQFTLVLTHDIESAQGLANVRRVADLEEELGFRSSFNFVPERYELDHQLIQGLGERGFEVGVHGLNHDGKLYCSENTFTNRADKINYYLKAFNATGFRSPLMHRNPKWLQALQIEYDLSFFDTDPYQPMPGGCMSIWPFLIGHFIELPYTLTQDCTLSYVLGERTPRLWLEKLEFIEKYCGMALLNTHPDYLRDSKVWDLYVAFLSTLVEKGNYWHALPNEVASWWRKRSTTPFGQESPEMTLGTILLENDDIALCQPDFSARQTNRL
jgi:peptidoglycan/xylan/chitin deacetylase (PgdA/CDA1 family)